jgi:hypothetical protein
LDPDLEPNPDPLVRGTDPWIRIQGSGSAPKCHESPTLLNSVIHHHYSCMLFFAFRFQTAQLLDSAPEISDSTLRPEERNISFVTREGTMPDIGKYLGCPHICPSMLGEFGSANFLPYSYHSDCGFKNVSDPDSVGSVGRFRAL